jgi:hypothetical protein
MLACHQVSSFASGVEPGIVSSWSIIIIIIIIIIG